jgi:hypothetical protein
MKAARARTLTRILAVVAALGMFAGSSIVRAQAPAAKLDITGTWIFTVETDAGTGTPTVTLKTDGEKVTGHYSSATLGEADLTGILKGPALEFKFVTTDFGEVIYKGTVESSNAIKGTLDIAGGAATGTFTAKRKE